MKYREFGKTGWHVSEIGYGVWGMGEWSGSDDEESLRSLQESCRLGLQLF
jgi:aryl-alcohol dehydrogenase-like predicted oxidoreductase